VRKHVKEFREFLLKQNAFALAIGVIIGAAIGKVVSGLVDDVLMPIIGVVLPGGEWRNAQLHLSGANAIKYGDLMGRLVDFLIVAVVVYLLTKVFLASQLAAPTKSCPECLEVVPLGARKCRACASPLPV
jgi:large conductance mechanosensitive channel